MAGGDFSHGSGIDVSLSRLNSAAPQTFTSVRIVICRPCHEFAGLLPYGHPTQQARTDYACYPGLTPDILELFRICGR